MKTARTIPTSSYRLPAKEQPAPCLTRGHPAYRRKKVILHPQERHPAPSNTVSPHSDAGPMVGLGGGHIYVTWAQVNPTRTPWIPHRSAVRRCGVGRLTVVTCEWCERVRHPSPTMGTASGCGTTTTSFVLPVETGIHGGVAARGPRLRQEGP